MAGSVPQVILQEQEAHLKMMVGDNDIDVLALQKKEYDNEIYSCCKASGGRGTHIVKSSRRDI